MEFLIALSMILVAAVAIVFLALRNEPPAFEPYEQEKVEDFNDS